MRRSGGPAIEELAREGDAKSIKFAVTFLFKILSLLLIMIVFGRICILLVPLPHKMSMI